MRHLLSRLRARGTAHYLERVTFCDECACILTPLDRFEELRERGQTMVRRAGLQRF